MVETYWNLSQAVRWIFWRRVDLAEAADSEKEQHAIFHRGGKLGPPVLPIVSARFRLIEALRAATVTAFDRDGKPYPAEIWKPLNLGRFPAGGATQGVSIVPDPETYKAPKPGPRPSIPINPKIPSAAVMAAWPDGATTAAAVVDVETPAPAAVMAAWLEATERAEAAAPTFWNLNETFRWIIWRSLEAVAAGGLAQAKAVMGQSVVGQGMPPSEARASFLESLRSGDLTAISGVPVSPETWARLRFEWAEDNSGIEIADDGSPGPTVPTNPKFSCVTTRALWRAIEPRPGWLAELRQWFFDELVPAHPKGLSTGDMEKEARKKFGKLSKARRDDVRALRRAPETPDVWTTAGPKGRADNKRRD